LVFGLVDHSSIQPFSFMRKWYALGLRAPGVSPNFSSWVDEVSQRTSFEVVRKRHAELRAVLMLKGYSWIESAKKFSVGSGFKWIKIPSNTMGKVAPIFVWRRKLFSHKFLKESCGLSILNPKLRGLMRLVMNGDKPLSNRVYFMGVVPIPISGQRPAYVLPTSECWLNFFNSSFWPKNVSKDGMTPDEYGTVGASWKYSIGHFRKLFTYSSRTIKCHDLIKIYRKYGHECKLPRVDGISAEEIKFTLVKGEAYSGIGSSRFWSNSKAGCVNIATDVAVKLFSELERVMVIDKSIWSWGARVRRERDTYTDGKEVECRGLQMPEFVPALISQVCVSVLTNFVIQNKESCLMLGAGPAYGGWLRLRETDQVDWVTVEGDWAFYDSTLKREHILAAFCIFRECFPDGTAWDNRFYYMMSGILHKNLAMPGGLVFQFQDGMPSGTPWTSLMNSLVNWLVIRDILDRCYDGDASIVKIQTGGDDFKLSFPPGSNIDMNLFSQVAKDVHGMELPANKIRIGKGGSSLEQTSTSFYKTIFINGMPTISLRDLEKRLAIPEISKSNHLEALNHCEAQLYSGIGLGGTRDLLCRYYAFLILYGKKLPTRQFRRKFSRHLGFAYRRHDEFRERILLTHDLSRVRHELNSRRGTPKEVLYDFREPDLAPDGQVWEALESTCFG
jgi:hypothetical protein